MTIQPEICLYIALTQMVENFNQNTYFSYSKKILEIYENSSTHFLFHNETMVYAHGIKEATRTSNEHVQFNLVFFRNHTKSTMLTLFADLAFLCYSLNFIFLYLS